MALLAQGVTTAVSALTVLLLAGRLDDGQYGLWQFFLLIGSYSGLLHLGLCDGVYLSCGGMLPEQLDAPRLGTLFRGMTALQLSAAALLSLIALRLGSGERLWAVIAALAYMPIFNAHAYLGCIAQATGHCMRYSASVMLDRLCFAAGAVTAVLAGAHGFGVFALITICSRLCATVLLCVTERRIAFAPHCRVHDIGRELRPGARLLLANLAGQLTTGAPRWAILLSLGEAALGRISLLITLAGMLTQLAAQLAAVLFPALRRERGDALERSMERLSAASMLLPILLLLMRPMQWGIGLLLPRYAEDSYLLSLLLPTALLDTRTQLVSLTELKVRRRDASLLALEGSFGVTELILCLGAAALGAGRVMILALSALASAGRCVAAELVCRRARHGSDSVDHARHGAEPQHHSTQHGTEPQRHSTQHGAVPQRQPTQHGAEPARHTALRHVSEPPRHTTQHGTEPPRRPTRHDAEPARHTALRRGAGSPAPLSASGAKHSSGGDGSTGSAPPAWRDAGVRRAVALALICLLAIPLLWALSSPK